MDARRGLSRSKYAELAPFSGRWNNGSTVPLGLDALNESKVYKVSLYICFNRAPSSGCVSARTASLIDHH